MAMLPSAGGSDHGDADDPGLQPREDGVGVEAAPPASGILGWFLSGSLHALAIIVLTLTLVSDVLKEKEVPPVRIDPLEPPTVVNQTETKYDLVEKLNPVEIQTEPVEQTSAVTVISDLDVPQDDLLQSDDQADTDGKHGRENADSVHEAGGEGVCLMLGAGGGAPGIYGKRNEWGKKRLSSQHYGPHGSEALSSLDAALRWLKKHQGPNGSWAEGYQNNCAEAPKCEPGKFGMGGSNCGVAYTGYAVLCFLGAGYDHRIPSKYRTVVKSGLDYLVSVQKEDGALGPRSYENAIAAMALAEAYAMSRDADLKEPAQRAVDAIIARQNRGDLAKDPYDLQGWDYGKPTARNDISVTGWNVMALKSAYAANLNTGHSLEASRRFLETTWKASNPAAARLTPYDKSVFPYTYNTASKEVAKDHLSFAGACMGVFLGVTGDDLMLQTLLNDVDDRWLKGDRYRGNLYAVYYASLAAFQAGEGRFKPWAQAYVPWLIDIQRHDESCFDGSFDFPKQTYHGGEGNRLLNHVYATLALEVAFRYEQIRAVQTSKKPLG